MTEHSVKRLAGGFTLVELLVSMVVIGIIGGMVAQALTGASRQAQDTRTQSLVDRLNMDILQMYEQLTRRATSAPTSNPATAYALNSQGRKSHALAVLNWRRDLLRCALPDHIQDVVDAPIDCYYPVLRRGYSGTPNLLARIDPQHNPSAPPSYVPPTTPWLNPSANIDSPAENSIRFTYTQKYRQRVLSLLQLSAGGTPANWAECVDGNTANGEWTTEAQSAECLYLILSSNTIDGDPMIASLNSRDIEDTDEDGIPEVIDPRGIPMGFLRWPVGHYLVNRWQRTPSVTQITDQITRLGKDSLDLLYSDPRFDNTDVTDDPFFVVPLIVSAGSDRVFDMVGLDAPTVPAVSYAVDSYPVAPTGVLATTGTPTFVDPYQYSLSVDERVGAHRDTADSGTDNTGDNVYPSFNPVP